MDPETCYHLLLPSIIQYNREIEKREKEFSFLILALGIGFTVGALSGFYLYYYRKAKK